MPRQNLGELLLSEEGKIRNDKAVQSIQGFGDPFIDRHCLVGDAGIF